MEAVRGTSSLKIPDNSGGTVAGRAESPSCPIVKTHAACTPCITCFCFCLLLCVFPGQTGLELSPLLPKPLKHSTLACSLPHYFFPLLLLGLLFCCAKKFPLSACGIFGQCRQFTLGISSWQGPGLV